MKTTKKHFEIFKAECLYWLDYFGIKNWETYFYHEKDTINIAWTRYNFTNRMVGVYFSTEWSTKIPLNKREIEKCAFHEVSEIFLYPLRYLAECRFLTESEIDPEIHNVIRTLENVIFKPMKSKAK